MIPPAAKRLSYAFRELADGLHYPGSESDAPYRAFARPEASTLQTAIARGDRVRSAEVEPSDLEDVLQLAAFWDVTEERAGEWFKRTTRNAEDADVHDQYEQLWVVMTATLDEVAHLIARDKTPGDGPFRLTRHYIAGRVTNGQGFAGLMARSVET